MKSVGTKVREGQKWRVLLTTLFFLLFRICILAGAHGVLELLNSQDTLKIDL